jgi:hypothetical protein
MEIIIKLSPEPFEPRARIDLVSGVTFQVWSFELVLHKEKFLRLVSLIEQPKLVGNFLIFGFLFHTFLLYTCFQPFSICTRVCNHVKVVTDKDKLDAN